MALQESYTQANQRASACRHQAHGRTISQEKAVELASVFTTLAPELRARKRVR